MKFAFKFEILKSLLKLYFERLAFERNPEKHQKKMWN